MEDSRKRRFEVWKIIGRVGLKGRKKKGRRKIEGWKGSRQEERRRWV